jgi:hypothetical protein
MKSKEEFWNEATSNRGLFNGIDHEYFIDNGCKVEKYTDGSIVIYNTMVGGDFYRVVKGEEREHFFRRGFDVASLNMAIWTIDEKVRVSNGIKFHTGYVEPEKSKRALNEYKQMRCKYYEKLNNILTHADTN